MIRYDMDIEQAGRFAARLRAAGAPPAAATWNGVDALLVAPAWQTEADGIAAEMPLPPTPPAADRLIAKPVIALGFLALGKHAAAEAAIAADPTLAALWPALTQGVRADAPMFVALCTALDTTPAAVEAAGRAASAAVGVNA